MPFLGPPLVFLPCLAAEGPRAVAVKQREPHRAAWVRTPALPLISWAPSGACFHFASLGWLLALPSFPLATDLRWPPPLCLGSRGLYAWCQSDLCFMTRYYWKRCFFQPFSGLRRGGWSLFELTSTALVLVTSPVPARPPQDEVSGLPATADLMRPRVPRPHQGARRHPGARVTAPSRGAAAASLWRRKPRLTAIRHHAMGSGAGQGAPFCAMQSTCS